ncbi:MAG: type II CAAX endopeptidase family protein [Nostocoides sp.]
MIEPFGELRDFARATLVQPVPRDHTESDHAFRRRRVVAATTLLLGAATMSWALRIPPGDSTFYAATLGLAVIWGAGAMLSGPLHLGHANTRTGNQSGRPIVQSLALGVLVLAIFLLGALVVSRFPLLRNPVQRLLDHARLGSLPLVALITAVNGIAEELYFRGALYAAIGRRHAVALTTLVYALTTIGPGIPLLALAAVVLGVVTGLQRRVTGGILGPIITHLTWSLGMLLLLPVTLKIGA